MRFGNGMDLCFGLCTVRGEWTSSSELGALSKTVQASDEEMNFSQLGWIGHNTSLDLLGLVFKS